MHVLWAVIHPRRHEHWSEESQHMDVLQSKKEGTGEFPGYGKLPKMILQQTPPGGRTTEGTPEKWHIVVL